MQNIAKGLTKRFAYTFSYKKTLINTAPALYQDNRQALKQNTWRVPDTTFKKSGQTHLSNGEYLISKVPVIQCDDAVVRCMGGTQSGAGHPQVYIQLNTKNAGEPVSCKWCGLRYALRHHH